MPCTTSAVRSRLIDRQRIQVLLTTILLILLSSNVYAWQQRVHYTMNIVLDAEAHSYKGEQRLVYVNNSPDTLRSVFYHLYYNAFKPGSMMDLRSRNLPDSRLRIWQLETDEQGDVRIDRVAQGGTQVTWDVDETNLRVTLDKPLLPGDSTVLEMSWTTRIPRLTRRGGWMSNEGVEFSMAQWYPKMAEYDASGWHSDEYIEREFYGVYGTFDVAITLPAEYIVGATGTVVNPNEVQCGYELGAIDTTLLSPASGKGTKTWKFHAEDVHDFAWVADRYYAHQIVAWRGIPIHMLFKQNVYDSWRTLGDLTRLTMEYYSRRFGSYSWPQFTVAMAGDGGMEYPQMIMITGYRGANALVNVMAHEVGHQWYYGMIGNNETQEAWLDEGFTQFLTDEARRKLFQVRQTSPYDGVRDLVYPWDNSPWRDIQGYYDLAVDDYDEPLTTFHDWYREGATSSLVYFKGEAVVRMLQNMLGDSLFDAGMRLYMQRWRYHHPGYRDYEKAMEDACGMRLDWFFNQWVGSKKTCDYAMDDLTSQQTSDGWTTTIALSNRDEIVMPLDITLLYDDGTTAVANIPVEGWRKPGVEFNLPRWKWVERRYTTTFRTPRQVVRATIDTSMLLLDLDRTNNTAPGAGPLGLLPPSSVAFYKRWDLNRPMEEYSIRLRPTLWYSQGDGPQLGFLADGGYTYDRYNATLGGYYNFKSHRVDYNVRYDTRLDLLGKGARIEMVATNVDGVQRWGASVTKAIPKFFFTTPSNQYISLRAEREVLVGPNYPNQVAPWEGGGYNILGMQYQWNALPSRAATLKATFGFDASFASRREFTQWQMKIESGWSWLGLGFGIDIFGGTSEGSPPSQRMFNAAGSRSIEMHRNPINRLAMNAEPGFAARNHLILPGDGYLLSLIESDSGARYAPHLLNGRLGIGGINPFQWLARVPILEDIDVEAYAAGGWVFHDAVTFDGFSDFNSEAGITASIDLLETFLPNTLIAALDSPAPVRLSFSLPFYAHSSYLGSKEFSYRWAIGVSM